MNAAVLQMWSRAALGRQFKNRSDLKIDLPSRTQRYLYMSDAVLSASAVLKSKKEKRK